MTSLPPEGFVAVGNYAFDPPYVPTIDQLEEAESFIFSQPVFESLSEDNRRRNVIRLAIHYAFMGNKEPTVLNLKDQLAGIAYVPLIGGLVKVTSKLHDGVVVREYELE